MTIIPKHLSNDHDTQHISNDHDTQHLSNDHDTQHLSNDHVSQHLSYDHDTHHISNDHDTQHISNDHCIRFSGSSNPDTLQDLAEAVLGDGEVSQLQFILSKIRRNIFRV
jgi:hypothetical protein